MILRPRSISERAFVRCPWLRLRIASFTKAGINGLKLNQRGKIGSTYNFKAVECSVLHRGSQEVMLRPSDQHMGHADIFNRLRKSWIFENGPFESFTLGHYTGYGDGGSTQIMKRVCSQIETLKNLLQLYVY